MREGVMLFQEKRDAEAEDAQPNYGGQDGTEKLLNNAPNLNGRGADNPPPEYCRHCATLSPMSAVTPYTPANLFRIVSLYCIQAIMLSCALYGISRIFSLFTALALYDSLFLGFAVTGAILSIQRSCTIKTGRTGFLVRYKDGQWTIYMEAFAWLFYNTKKKRREFLVNELSKIINYALNSPYVKKVSVVTWFIPDPAGFTPKPANSVLLSRREALVPAITATLCGVIANIATQKWPDIKPLRSPWYRLTWKPVPKKQIIERCENAK